MLKTTFFGKGLKNPLVLASGILGTGSDILNRVGKYAGLVTTKSIGPVERLGNKNPCVLEVAGGIINCVGLPSPGYLHLEEEIHGINTPWIASIYGHSVGDFVKIAKHVSGFNPDFIELNMSCPNTSDGMAFATNKDASIELVKEVKKTTKIRVIAKLTPNVTNIVEIAKSVESAGADAITAINSVGPGMIINADVKKPVLSFKTGGLTGPMIKPIALRCVYQIYENVKIPIIGTGGILTGTDAVEMMMAGASLVGIGSATYKEGVNAFARIAKELESWMKANGYKEVKELVGIAH
ncbi:dihydroorotate dehydrogenase [Candidatus Woesearchaeota archaeon]|nr:dihydroorotate dehydrogenase [Candidatus Woesearchaeota archaeon]